MNPLTGNMNPLGGGGGGRSSGGGGGSAAFPRMHESFDDDDDDADDNQYTDRSKQHANHPSRADVDATTQRHHQQEHSEKKPSHGSHTPTVPPPASTSNAHKSPTSHTTGNRPTNSTTRPSASPPMGRGASPPITSGGAATSTDNLTQAAKILSSQPQNIGAILAKVNVLQKQANDIETKIKALQEQKKFAGEENVRATSLCESASKELAAAKSRVDELTKWRDDHVCNADADSYKTYENLSREIRSAELRLERKEEHVQAILAATHNVMKEVTAFKNTDKGGHYLAILQEKTDEQQVELTRQSAAFEERARLEQEVSDNEEMLRHLREKLEKAGVPIPDAPMVHRTKRLVRRTNTAEVESRTRVLRLPVGVLRALAHHLGGSVRDVALDTGVAEIAVEIQETATLLHCKGLHVALDSFEGKVQAAMSAVESEHDVGGVITYTDAAVSLTYDKAVGSLKSLLTTPVKKSSAAAQSVGGGAEVMMIGDISP